MKFVPRLTIFSNLNHVRRKTKVHDVERQSKDNCDVFGHIILFDGVLVLNSCDRPNIVIPICHLPEVLFVGQS